MYCHPVKIQNKRERQNLTNEERKINNKIHNEKRTKVRNNTLKKNDSNKKLNKLHLLDIFQM